MRTQYHGLQGPSKSEVQMMDIENISLFQENIIPLIQSAWLPKAFGTLSMTVLITLETQKFIEHSSVPKTLKDFTQIS